VRITIDNLDGLGAIDYTEAVVEGGPITVQRALNEPSRCTAEIILGVEGLAVPVRRGRVTVTAADGTVLFTGYLATEPVRIYAGNASTGPVYRARVTAVSDEWLLDNLGSGAGLRDAESLGLNGTALVTQLASRAQAGGSAGVTIATSGTVPATGAFAARASSPFSVNAANAASSAYASYRALNGQILIQPVGNVTIALSDANGTLSVSELQTSAVRELANDVTLTGAEEPAAYIQENFFGDGTTTVFDLTESAYRDANRTLVLDNFNEATFNPAQWIMNDPGSHLSLTSAGLTMNGGNGSDGQTTLIAIDAVEMGGAVIVQMSQVILAAASNGMLAGMYAGLPPVLAECFAGFRVRQSVSGTGGVTVIVPIVNGVEVGTVFTPIAGHSYTLRLRLHCVEMQRVMQPYYCMVDGVVQSFGSLSGVAAPMDVVFELVDEGDSSNTYATVLYDSAAAGAPLSNTPATCAFVLVNSTQLFGSIGAISVTRPGSMWVVSTLPSGALETRLIGVAGQGVDCTASYGTAAGSPGKVTFLAGRVPVAGERITVNYRNEQRSVARLADTASITSEAVNGAPGTCRFLGAVTLPIARSSADCESAAQSVLAFATSRTAAVAGTYAMVNPAVDLWPGDILAITSAGVTSSLLVRSVVVKDGGAVPEVRQYAVSFANDWATEWEAGIGTKLSEEIAADAYLPQTASSAPGQVLANLQQLTVTSLTDTVLQVNAGMAPPAGGGFEVRLRDWEFGVGVDGADLVLRSSVQSFSIPYAAQLERYYVRMYDASMPPLYSRFSSAVFVNMPVNELA
jgi:hypothetical protein